MKKSILTAALFAVVALALAPAAQATEHLPWYLDPEWDCGEMDPAACDAAKQAKAQEVRAERIDSFAREDYDSHGCFDRGRFAEDYLDRYQNVEDIDYLSADVLRAEAAESYLECRALADADQEQADRAEAKRQARNRRLGIRECEGISTDVDRYPATVEVTARHASCAIARRLARASLAADSRGGRLNGWRRTSYFNRPDYDRVDCWEDRCDLTMTEWRYRAIWRRGAARITLAGHLS